MRRTWSLIVITTLASLACWGAALASLRALAQSPPPEEAAQTGTAPVSPSPAPQEPPPEERGSADNSVSFPVDI